MKQSRSSGVKNYNRLPLLLIMMKSAPAARLEAIPGTKLRNVSRRSPTLNICISASTSTSLTFETSVTCVDMFACSSRIRPR